MAGKFLTPNFVPTVSLVSGSGSGSRHWSKAIINKSPSDKPEKGMLNDSMSLASTFELSF